MSAKTNEKPSLEFRMEPADPFAKNFAPEIYARGKSHFQITFLFVRTTAQKQSLKDLYSFCRLADDYADEQNLSLPERKAALEALSQWLLNSKKIGHPFWDRFLDEINEYQIPIRSLEGLLDGMKMDLENIRLQTWADLNLYCYRVASCVGEAVLAILGVGRDERSRPYAYSLGLCLQYLNILRDLESDLKEGRNYLPEEFSAPLEAQNKTKNEIFAIARSTLYERAMKFRAAAIAYSWRCLAAELMAGIYIYGAEKYWRFGSPQRLSSLQKLKQVLKISLKFLTNPPH